MSLKRKQRSDLEENAKHPQQDHQCIMQSLSFQEALRLASLPKNLDLRVALRKEFKFAEDQWAVRWMENLFPDGWCHIMQFVTVRELQMMEMTCKSFRVFLYQGTGWNTFFRRFLERINESSEEVGFYSPDFYPNQLYCAYGKQEVFHNTYGVHLQDATKDEDGVRKYWISAWWGLERKMRAEWYAPRYRSIAEGFVKLSLFNLLK